LKGAFQGFLDKVVQQKNFLFEFEQPFRALGFHGTPHRSMVLIMPTTTCVVQLTEWVDLFIFFLTIFYCFVFFKASIGYCIG
jgi:nucleosome binding factor SPN SPT16 subunit